MALDARTRSSIYGKFAEMLGDDDANALMSEFPSVEADELVTKQFLRAELGVFRSEFRAEISVDLSELRDEFGQLRGEFGQLRGEVSELRGEFGQLRGEFGQLRDEFGQLRGEFGVLGSDLGADLTQNVSTLRGEITELRVDMLERFHRQTVWLAGTVVASAGAVIAAIPLLG